MKYSVRRLLFFTPLVLLLASFSTYAQKANEAEKMPFNPPAVTKPQTTETIISFSALEKAVIDELNFARSNPVSFIAYLEDYKKSVRNNMLYLPNRQGIRMNEGTAAIDDAIVFLKNLEKLDSCEISDGLRKVASSQLIDLQENPALGHNGKDGSDLKTRFTRFGTVNGAAAENITYLFDQAREVILSMIIDDGVPSRLHRKNVFNPKFKMVGVACGAGKNNSTICVANFAEKFSDKSEKNEQVLEL